MGLCDSLSDPLSEIRFFAFQTFYFFAGAIYVSGRHGLTCISSQHCVRFTMVECTGVLFDVS